ncbi:hypothetical protein D9756_010444 [Leucocoprinus leucothites]|uniref:Myb/SANT-like domain-containing protein n=1 Tax=Leucocoprinus leucothites TaxID=201217 RepID=A0A8H5CSE4_9AGAR|nr:hypothetical protein D9756_010444 [Leucoagaricus leucothites]
MLFMIYNQIERTTHISQLYNSYNSHNSLLPSKSPSIYLVTCQGSIREGMEVINKIMSPCKQNKASEPCAHWSDEENMVMCRVLTEKKDRGNQSGAGWKCTVWTTVAEALAKEVTPKGPVKDASKCADHWANFHLTFNQFKKNFLEVVHVCDASGMGWDDALKICMATDEVWEPLIKTFSHASYWHRHSFPCYDEMHYLIKGVVATSAGAFHPSETPVSSPVVVPSSPVTLTSELPNQSEPSAVLSDLSTDSIVVPLLGSNDKVNSNDISYKTPVSKKHTHASSPDTPPRPVTSKERLHCLQNETSHSELIGALHQMVAAMSSRPDTPLCCKSAAPRTSLDAL